MSQVNSVELIVNVLKRSEQKKGQASLIKGSNSNQSGIVTVVT